MLGLKTGSDCFYQMMFEEISFGEERIERMHRVSQMHNGAKEKVGLIKKQDGRDKWMWIPTVMTRERFPFCILERELDKSKQIVHKMLTGW